MKIDSPNDIEALRVAMVDQILSWQPLSAPVAAAMRKVERHLFVPHVPVEQAYVDDSVVIRRDGDGVATSSASGPWLVGRMLDQLELRPGMRVLEVGGGTGYNSALIAELVGPRGHVTTLEIAADVAADARAALATAGVTNVEVISGDGQYGHPPGAPYDRIIATAGGWEIPQAWADQLAPDGVLVVPLRMKGITRSVAFTRDDNRWRSDSVVNCGFIPMRGDGAMPERNIRVAEDIVVRLDDGHDVDAEALARAAADPGTVEWTGIHIDAPLDLLDFWLADLDGFCRVLANDTVVERGLAEPLNGWGSMGVATAEALGYLTKRTSHDNPHVLELGVCAYGPAADRTVRELTKRVHRWASTRTSVTGVRLEVHPAGEGDTTDALLTVDKRHSRVIVKPETTSAHEPAPTRP
jgi:protein-L-isoaspartate(D-aspartate) O-methyltransferase